MCHRNRMLLEIIMCCPDCGAGPYHNINLNNQYEVWTGIFKNQSNQTLWGTGSVRFHYIVLKPKWLNVPTAIVPSFKSLWCNVVQLLHPSSSALSLFEGWVVNDLSSKSLNNLIVSCPQLLDRATYVLKGLTSTWNPPEINYHVLNGLTLHPIVHERIWSS